MIYDPDQSKPSLLKFLSSPVNLLIFHLLANNKSMNGKWIYWDKRMIHAILKISQKTINSFFARLYDLRQIKQLSTLIDKTSVKGQEHYTFSRSKENKLIPMDKHPKSRKIYGYRLFTSKIDFIFNQNYEIEQDQLFELKISLGSNRNYLESANTLLYLLSNPAMRSLLAAFNSFDEELTLKEIIKRYEEKEETFRRQSFSEIILPTMKTLPSYMQPLKILMMPRKRKKEIRKEAVYRIRPKFFALRLNFLSNEYQKILKLNNMGRFFHVGGYVL